MRPSRGDGRVPGETGIWVFIFGDLVVFTVLFCVFVHERSRSPEEFERGRQALSLTFGTVNTLLLLTGSVCVVLGLHALRRGAARSGAWSFVVTLLCGAGFVVDKYLEYAHEIQAGHGPSVNVFFMYYFVLTGIHLLHLLIGMAALVIMYRIARTPAPGAEEMRVLEAGGCYWHLVDLLWIVLFALLYLMR
ncbi:cytochrome c oxidase subunit 3 family protein [Streptomyces sp. NPDC059255]|uniref:cytochrome c oxidase subunit 3 family protein n=1 Tax=Streptomyces sp. NPDC059255 TaxID=3346793 RepID=UPI00367D5575